AAAEAKVQEIRDGGGDAIALVADVLDQAKVASARDEVLETRGRVDILVNAAGGNVARARSDDRPVFDVPLDAFDEVLQLNLHGSHTERARAIISHTPMGRFGKPEEVVGTVQWLCSDAAAFVTGAVIPVDGGFSVASGV